MKTMKLTAFCLAVFSVLMFVSCGDDDPQGIRGTKWAVRISGAELNEMMITEEDEQMPNDAEVIFTLDFFGDFAAYLYVQTPLNMVVPEGVTSTTLKFEMPYSYDEKTDKLIFKLSKINLLSSDPAISLEHFADIDFEEAQDVLGEVDWKQKMLSVKIQEDGAPDWNLVFKQK